MTTVQAEQLQALYDRFYNTGNLQYEVYIAYDNPTSSIGSYVVITFDGIHSKKYSTNTGRSNITILDDEYIKIYHNSTHELTVTLKKDCKVKFPNDQLDIEYKAGDIIRNSGFHSYCTLKFTF